MSNYTKSTNFATKDNLTPGDPLKVVRGTEIDTEYNNIATAIATKTDNASAAITGGTITGITDLAVADGGTGASTAAGALNNLLPSQTSAANKYLQSDGTNASWDAVTLSTADITGTLPVANGGTGVTASTGTGSVVLSNSPTLVTPALGTPASGVATNLTGLPISTGVSGLGTGVATFLGTPSSANLISAITDETGTGSLVFATSPTLVTPALGTPSALVGTNITGTASGLTAGNVTTNANLTGAVTSVGNATSLGSFSSANLLGALTDETGTGSAVFATSPTLVTPILGTPTSATLTNATGLPIATGVSGLGTGVATFLATPSSANLAAALTDETGSGSAVFATSPTLVTPVLGTPTSATLTNATGLPLTTGVTGTLPTANGGTNLGGATPFTSGGVVYASSTSALATGSALTFDGTTFGVNNGVAGGTAVSLTGTYSGSGSVNFLTFQRVGGAVAGALRYSDDNPFGMMFGTTTSHAQIFMTANTERMRISNGGDVGIGTSSPSSKLHVGVVGGGVIARFAHTGETNNPYAYFKTNEAGNIASLGSFSSGSNSALGFLTADTERMRISDTGAVGIGTSSPSGKLDVNGDLKVSPNTAGKNTFTFTTNASNDGRLFIKSDTTDKVDIQANGTSYFEGGTVRFISTISVGNATPTTSGAGITFPATQSASSNANTLDDYEEGTFTVTFTPSTSGTITLSGSYNTLSYTKVGRLVTVTGELLVSSVSTPVGSSVSIGNLPFTAGSGFSSSSGFGILNLGAGTVPGARVNDNTNVIDLRVDASTIATNYNLMLAFSYIV